jgi:hypothetical protein
MPDSYSDMVFTIHRGRPYRRDVTRRGRGYCYTVKQKLRRGGGPQTDKHLLQSPFTGQFFKDNNSLIAV